MDIESQNQSVPFGMGIKHFCLFARTVLREICQENTARECLLKELENLFTSELILDPILNPEQKRHLIQLLCYPLDAAIQNRERQDNSGRLSTQYILRGLDQWNLRVTWMEVMLMQQNLDGQNSDAPEMFAKAVIDAFQLKGPEIEKAATPAKKNKSFSSLKYELDPGRHVYYLAPLIAKLPPLVQQRVLHYATSVLMVSSWSVKSKDRDKITKSNLLLGHPPFVSMVLSCLDFAKDVDQDGLRSDLLTSLFNQLTGLSKEERNYSGASDIVSRAPVIEALSLRLSLVGSLIEVIHKNMKVLAEWVVLLAQLIVSGTVEPQSAVFITVMDMMMVLIHVAINASNDTAVFSPPGSGAAGSSSSGDKMEEKKLYSTLVKRIRKEIGERRGAGIEYLKMLLPLTKKNHSIVFCEPYGMVTDGKGNKVLQDKMLDRKSGMRVSHKVELNPWDLLEGFKNSSPLSHSLFSAIKIEKKLLLPELRARLLTWHNHEKPKAIEYFLEPPPLPPLLEEDRSTGHDEPNESETTSVETSSPRSPRGSRQKNRKASSGNSTPAKKRAPKGVAPFMQPPGYGAEPAQPNPQQSAMWFGGPGMPQQQRMPGAPRMGYSIPPYMSGPPGGTRDVRSSLMNTLQQRQGNMPMGQPQQPSTSKPTLNHMLTPNQPRPPMPNAQYQQAMLQRQMALQQQQSVRQNLMRQQQMSSQANPGYQPQPGMTYVPPDQQQQQPPYGHVLQQQNQEAQSQQPPVQFMQEFQPQQPPQMFMSDPNQNRQVQQQQIYRQQAGMVGQQNVQQDFMQSQQQPQQQQQSQFGYRPNAGR